MEALSSRFATKADLHSGLGSKSWQAGRQAGRQAGGRRWREHSLRGKRDMYVLWEHWEHSALGGLRPAGQGDNVAGREGHGDDGRIDDKQ